jgi:predicted alpha/beta hydrolase family esterase
VQRWREAHPGYWQRVKAKAKSGLLLDVSPVTRSKKHHPQSMPALQDRVLPLQDSIRRNPLIVGLVAHVFGCALQDSVEKVIGELIIRGMELRARMHGAKTISRKSAKYDAQKTRASRKPAPVTGAGQMACTPPGAR